MSFASTSSTVVQKPISPTLLLNCSFSSCVFLRFSSLGFPLLLLLLFPHIISNTSSPGLELLTIRWGKLLCSIKNLSLLLRQFALQPCMCGIIAEQHNAFQSNCCDIRFLPKQAVKLSEVSFTDNICLWGTGCLLLLSAERSSCTPPQVGGLLADGCKSQRNIDTKLVDTLQFAHPSQTYGAARRELVTSRQWHLQTDGLFPPEVALHRLPTAQICLAASACSCPKLSTCQIATFATCHNNPVTSLPSIPRLRQPAKIDCNTNISLHCFQQFIWCAMDISKEVGNRLSQKVHSTSIEKKEC